MIGHAQNVSIPRAEDQGNPAQFAKKDLGVLKVRHGAYWTPSAEAQTMAPARFRLPNKLRRSHLQLSTRL